MTFLCPPYWLNHIVIVLVWCTKVNIAIWFEDLSISSLAITILLLLKKAQYYNRRGLWKVPSIAAKPLPSFTRPRDWNKRCRSTSRNVLIPWCGPFFLVWPAAMSQRRRSEVSTPRHNSLSGKNNSLMPDSSYIVWDDSELGEAYCLDVFVVQVYCEGMRGFPPWRVYLDLCVKSRELCMKLHSLGSGAWTVHVCGNLF